MKHVYAVAISACLCLAVSAELPVAEFANPRPVDFAADIYPILKQNCLACHNSSKAKAGLSLESPAAMRKGGDSGAAVIPGDGATSYVFTSAAHRDEPEMPPKKNKSKARNLDPDELSLLKAWIDQGAKGDPIPPPSPTTWTPLAGPQPVYALAVSADGRFAAAGVGQQVQVFDLMLKRAVASWEAHRDSVQSIAFSPNGDLATGGYGSAKIWRYAANTPIAESRLPFAPIASAVSADGKHLAATAADGRLLLLTFPDSSTIETDPGISALAFSPDSQTLASAHGKLLRRRPLADFAAAKDHEFDATIQALAYVGDSQIALAIAGQNTVRIWNLQDSAVVKTLDHGAPAQGLAVSPDGTRLLAVSGNRLPTLWDTATGNRIAELKASQAHALPVAIAKKNANSAKLLYDHFNSELPKAEDALKKEAESGEAHLAAATARRDQAKADLDAAVAAKAAADQAAKDLLTVAAGLDKIPVVGQAFLADGSLVTSDANGNLRRWSPSGEHLHSQSGVANSVLHRGGDQLLVVEDDGQLKRFAPGPAWSLAGSLDSVSGRVTA